MIALVLMAGCTGQPPVPAGGQSAGAESESTAPPRQPPADSSSDATPPGPVSTPHTITTPPSTPIATSSLPRGTDEESAIPIPTVTGAVEVHLLPTEEAPIHWNFDAVGQKYAVIPGKELFKPTPVYDHPARQAVVIRLADNAVVARYSPPTVDRYVSRSFFYADYIVLFVEVVGAAQMDSPPPVWAIRIDARTGAQVNLTKRLGDEVTGIGFSMALSGRDVVISSPNFVAETPLRSVCFRSIDVVTQEYRDLGCAPEERHVGFVNPVSDGFSFQTYPSGGYLSDCRHRYLVDLATAVHTEMADGRNCRVWDGVEVDGWQVWSSQTSEDNAIVLMERSTIFARSPRGTVYTLGVSQSSHMFVCGADVYFLTLGESQKKATASKKLDDRFDEATELRRWRPGSSSAETVYTVDGYDMRSFGAALCTDNTVTVGYYGQDDYGGYIYGQYAWFSARS